MNNHHRKVLVIGLDCATPQLIFDQWLDDLPNIKKLIENGLYGELESTTPPITVPAWTSMMTSKDPGQLGLYGFRNRKNYTYDQMYFANARLVKEPAVWDILSMNGKTSIVLGVPQTYPPKPINGLMVASFLTPDKSCKYTYPDNLKEEIDLIADNYIIDVDNFRTDDKDSLLAQIYEMTEKRFKVAKHFIKNKPWDFFMMVEMGPDRIHHGFWKYFDHNHIKYKPGSKYENAVKEYYVYLDKEIGEVLSIVDENTAIIVVSDHGAKKMAGGICVNEWLQQEGYLKLKEKPVKISPLKSEMIDWKHTKAWGEGGYYSRIFMNVKGREPEGIIEMTDYEKVRDELIQKFQALTNENGENIGTKVFKPQDIYKECKNIPPDLIVYFGNLDWRSVGSVGFNTIHVFENDTGPDDANHAQHGIFIMSEKENGKVEKRKKLKGLHIMDIAPTVLNILGVSVPIDMRGKIIK